MIVLLIIGLCIIMYALPLISWSRIPRLSISRSTITHTPITLYRTSNSRIVSQKLYRNCYQKWINLNNNLCIEWFDESDRLRFMRTQGKVLLETYEALKPGAFKADLFRLCILYQKGGSICRCRDDAICLSARNAQGGGSTSGK